MHKLTISYYIDNWGITQVKSLTNVDASFFILHKKISYLSTVPISLTFCRLKHMNMTQSYQDYWGVIKMTNASAVEIQH